MVPLLDALRSNGLWTELATLEGVDSLNHLADRFNVPRGLLQWAGSLLEGQGLASRRARPGPDADFSLALTPTGLAMPSDVESFESRMAWLRAMLASNEAIPSDLLNPVRYTVCYLNTLQTIPLLFNGLCSDSVALKQSDSDEESHVNRALDIALSGSVYRKNCRAPLHEIIVPLFADASPRNHPEAIVDTGAGDASLLLDIHEAIRHIPGAHLPLFVAVEYNEVARREAKRRMQEAGVEGFAIFGDIAHPEAICQQLVTRGIQPDHVLHVSKSVFHNRRYESPTDTEGCANWTTSSARIYVGENGRYITAREAEWHLVEVLQRWRACCGHHGLVVIEAHGADPQQIAKTTAPNIMTLLEATHGLTHQMLVPAASHRRAFEHAQFLRVQHYDLGTRLFGTPTMTIDYWHP